MDSEPPYSNREIREHWHAIANSLTRIEAQTVKTNGRVTAGEKWRYLMMGAIIVLSAIVLPLMSWALLTIIQLDNKVSAASFHTMAPDL